MKVKQNLTIDDIARELGISKTTVSRAISGKGRISVETRARVQAYIQEHNYRPNAAAKGLAESRTYNLALVLPHSFIKLDQPYVRQSMTAICEEAYLHDYNVMICLTTENQFDPLIRTLDYRKADGVILTRTVENDNLIDLLSSRSIPFATLGSLPSKSHGKAVIEADHDQTGGCRDFTCAWLRGKTGKTALLGGDLSYIVNQSRVAGFRRACQELELPMEQTPIRVELRDDPSCGYVLDELLHQGVKRFLCMDDKLCVEVLRQLAHRQLQVPTDVEVACLSYSDLLEPFGSAIPSLRFDATQLGRVACQELLHCLHGEPFNPTPVLGYEMLHLTK